MAASTTSRSSTPAGAGTSDWMFGFVMGGVTLTLIAAIWGWSQLNYRPNTQRPRPVWMDISRVISQLSDGRMLKVHVGLRLQNTEAANALKPHQDIFKSMVEEVSAEMSHDELQGPEGMRKLSQHIRATFNDYLADQAVPYRVKDVLFEEWTLMP
jgi:hypothetical protein